MTARTKKADATMRTRIAVGPQRLDHSLRQLRRRLLHKACIARGTRACKPSCRCCPCKDRHDNRGIKAAAGGGTDLRRWRRRRRAQPRRRPAPWLGRRCPGPARAPGPAPCRPQLLEDKQRGRLETALLAGVHSSAGDAADDPSNSMQLVGPISSGHASPTMMTATLAKTWAVSFIRGVQSVRSVHLQSPGRA